MKKPLFTLGLLSGILTLSTAHAGNISGKVVNVATKKGVDGAVVYIVKAAGAFKPGKAVLNQANKEFSPSVLPVLAGTKVLFDNMDDVKHEAYSFSPAKKFTLPLFGAGGQKPAPLVFDKPGVVNIGCNIHDWMSATIMVLQNPYFETTNSDGTFMISGVPNGNYDLTFFHPGGKPVTVKVSVPSKGPVTLASQFRPVVKKQRPADDRSSGGRY